MQARFTPAEGAGSMIFSTSRRDRASYVGESWATRDRPWWMPERLALILLDELDLHSTVASAICIAMAVTALCGGRWITRRLYGAYRWRRSSFAAREIIRMEKEEAAARHSAAASKVDAAKLTSSDSCTSEGAMVRYCRYCDVPIEDEYMAAHESGKKHRRRLDAAGALARGHETCWEWRQAPTQAEQTPEPSTGTAAHEVLLPSSTATSAGKGLGAWTAVGRQPKARKKK
jgi:hypothetical protein